MGMHHLHSFSLHVRPRLLFTLVITLGLGVGYSCLESVASSASRTARRNHHSDTPQSAAEELASAPLLIRVLLLPIATPFPLP